MSLPGLYIHVPFCSTKCPYCGFYSIPSQSQLSRWLDALKKEAVMHKDPFESFDSLYLGGGTPSLLNLDSLDGILSVLFSQYRFRDDTEMTLEANPGDITRDKAKGFRAMGFNRINLGIQSFDDDELRFLGRRHTVEKAENAFEILRSVGFENIGIDLIYGYQAQSLEAWKRSLGKAVSFQPEHISCYQLTIEKKTVFGMMKEKGELVPLGEEEESSFFLTTSDFLEAWGYIHYEISNFAKGERYYSRHNCKYWSHTPYLGMGTSAHSFKDYTRWWNLSSLKRYCKSLEQGDLPIEGNEGLSEEQIRLEAVSLGLRTRKGFDMALIKDTPGIKDAITRLVESGFIKVDNGMVSPTKKGFLVADSLPLSFI